MPSVFVTWYGAFVVSLKKSEVRLILERQFWVSLGLPLDGLLRPDGPNGALRGRIDLGIEDVLVGTVVARGDVDGAGERGGEECHEAESEGEDGGLHCFEDESSSEVKRERPEEFEWRRKGVRVRVDEYPDEELASPPPRPFVLAALRLRSSEPGRAMLNARAPPSDFAAFAWTVIEALPCCPARTRGAVATLLGGGGWQ